MSNFWLFAFVIFCLLGVFLLFELVLWRPVVDTSCVISDVTPRRREGNTLKWSPIARFHNNAFTKIRMYRGKVPLMFVSQRSRAFRTCCLLLSSKHLECVHLLKVETTYYRGTAHSSSVPATITKVHSSLISFVVLDLCHVLKRANALNDLRLRCFLTLLIIVPRPCVHPRTHSHLLSYS